MPNTLRQKGVLLCKVQLTDNFISNLRKQQWFSFSKWFSRALVSAEGMLFASIQTQPFLSPKFLNQLYAFLLIQNLELFLRQSLATVLFSFSPKDSKNNPSLFTNPENKFGLGVRLDLTGKCITFMNVSPIIFLFSSGLVVTFNVFVTCFLTAGWSFLPDITVELL